MKDLKDLLPKKMKVAVGEEVLTLATMTAAQRDAVFGTLFEQINMDELISTLEGAAKIAAKTADEDAPEGAEMTQRAFFLTTIIDR